MRGRIQGRLHFFEHILFPLKSLELLRIDYLIEDLSAGSLLLKVPLLNIFHHVIF